MKKIYRISILLFLGLFLNSCGILFNKNPNRIYVNSNPDSAKVYHNDSLLGVTPAYIEVEGKNKNYILTLSKEGFENRSFIVEKTMNDLPFWLDVMGIYPMFITYLSGYDYKHYITKNDYIFLKTKDSLKNKFKRDFGNSLLIAEGTPFISLFGGFVGITANYYKEIYRLNIKEETSSSLGVKCGWGFGGIALGDIISEGFGYNIMPSYSYERFTDFDDYQDKSCKYIFSLGASYSQKIDRPSTNYPYGSKYNLYHGILPSFSFQNITMYYEKRIFWGYSLGYVNAVNFFQFSFGYRF
ncbi:MAG: PEGA domain-containing protein [Candidatus Kapabacteria bacterium]|nr:PEGA domain-containing protein [Candidatus Kapabacteria bacterium]